VRDPCRADSVLEPEEPERSKDLAIGPAELPELLAGFQRIGGDPCEPVRCRVEPSKCEAPPLEVGADLIDLRPDLDPKHGPGPGRVVRIPLHDEILEGPLRVEQPQQNLLQTQKARARPDHQRVAGANMDSLCAARCIQPLDVQGVEPHGG
jgi:hypothetical protein